MIYHVTNSINYSNWIDLPITNDLEKATIVMFSGGEDVNPSLYGEKPHSTTYFNSQRDKLEKETWHKAVKMDKFCLFICRGSQLCTVLNGGKLVQHVTNHGGNHPMTTYDGKEFEVTSTHHQMMYPYNLEEDNYKILGWSSENRSNVYWKNDKEQFDFSDKKEPEIVWYPKTKSLAIQNHPEIQQYGAYHDYLNNLIKKLI